MILEITDKEELSILKNINIAAEFIGVKAFPVGGYVRDLILKRSQKDIDVVTDGDGIELAIAFAGLYGKKQDDIAVFQRFGTAMIKVAGFDVEFVGARKESYSRDSRKPSVCKGTLRDDQFRRDFTINAMAIHIDEENFGLVVDPFSGLSDIEHKIIRTPLLPKKTFSDDPLRMLRAIRFAAQLGYTIYPETFEGIKDTAGRISIISKERVHVELNKILMAEKPSLGFNMLDETGLLQYILPELVALKGVEIRNGVGHKDNFIHTLEVLDNIAKTSDYLYLRWAALLHDIAKPSTKRFDEDYNIWTFHGHEVVGASIAYQIFKRLKLPLDNKMKYVQKMIRLHLRPISLSKADITDSAIRRLLFDAGEDIDDLMLLAEADITSKNEGKVNKYLTNYQTVRRLLHEVEDKDKLRVWQPPLDGMDIMDLFHLQPGREVGLLKNAIKEAILDGQVKNNIQDTLDFLLERGNEMNLIPDEKIVISIRSRD